MKRRIVVLVRVTLSTGSERKSWRMPVTSPTEMERVEVIMRIVTDRVKWSINRVADDRSAFFRESFERMR